MTTISASRQALAGVVSQDDDATSILSNCFSGITDLSEPLTISSSLAGSVIGNLGENVSGLDGESELVLPAKVTEFTCSLVFPVIGILFVGLSTLALGLTAVSLYASASISLNESREKSLLLASSTTIQRTMEVMSQSVAVMTSLYLSDSMVPLMESLSLSNLSTPEWTELVRTLVGIRQSADVGLSLPTHDYEMGFGMGFWYGDYSNPLYNGTCSRMTTTDLVAVRYERDTIGFTAMVEGQYVILSKFDEEDVMRNHRNASVLDFTIAHSEPDTWNPPLFGFMCAQDGPFVVHFTLAEGDELNLGLYLGVAFHDDERKSLIIPNGKTNVTSWSSTFGRLANDSGLVNLWLYDVESDVFLASSLGGPTSTDSATTLPTWSDYPELMDTNLNEIIASGTLFEDAVTIPLVGQVATVVDATTILKVAQLEVEGFPNALYLIHMQSVWRAYGFAVFLVALSFSVAIVVSVSVTVGVCTVSCSLFHTFRKLQVQLNRVTDMDLDNIPLPKTCLRELAILIRQFAWMLRQLKHYRSFLPSGMRGDPLVEGGDEFQESVSSCSSISGSSDATSTDRSTLSRTTGGLDGAFVYIRGRFSNETDLFEEILKKIHQSAMRYGGRLLWFSALHSEVVVAFLLHPDRLVTLASRFAVALQSIGIDECRVGIGLAFGKVSVRSIGTPGMKIRHYEGSALDLARTFAEFALRSAKPGRILILASRDFVIRISKTSSMFFAPRDVFISQSPLPRIEPNVKFNRTILAYSVFDPFSGVVLMDGEWMYVHERARISEEITSFQSCVDLFAFEGKEEDLRKILTSEKSVVQLEEPYSVFETLLQRLAEER